LSVDDVGRGAHLRHTYRPLLYRAPTIVPRMARIREFHKYLFTTLMEFVALFHSISTFVFENYPLENGT
jgi:hypothetical protein